MGRVSTDVIRLVFTYSIATLLIIGGLLILYLTRLDPPESNSQNVALAVVGLMGAATQWVFAKDQAAQTARQIERSAAAGAAVGAAATAAAMPIQVPDPPPADPGR